MSGPPPTSSSIADAVPGTPSMTASPSYSGRPSTVGNTAVAMSPVFSSRMRTVVRSPVAGDEAALDGERPDAGEQVAAGLRVADGRGVDADLQEQVVDVDPFGRRGRHDRDLAGERVGAADAVDLARVGRSHDPQQQVVARCRVARQVRREEVRALRRAAAHEHAADAVAHRRRPSTATGDSGAPIAPGLVLGLRDVLDAELGQEGPQPLAVEAELAAAVRGTVGLLLREARIGRRERRIRPASRAHAARRRRPRR